MPFESVAETLLKSGVRPRHVRRYMRELGEHLDDLVRAEHAAGQQGEAAASRARARLGSDGELATAMLAQPGMRSWPARAPFAVFVLLPPLVAIFGVMPLFLLFYFLGDGAWRLSALAAPEQEGVRAFARLALSGLNLVFVPLVAALFAWLARRQRLDAFWPLLGMALLLLIFPHIGYGFGLPHHPHSGRIGIGVAPVFVPTSWSAIARHWQVMAGQWLLALAPAVWLLHRRQKTAA